MDVYDNDVVMLSESDDGKEESFPEIDINLDLEGHIEYTISPLRRDKYNKAIWNKLTHQVRNSKPQLTPKQASRDRFLYDLREGTYVHNNPYIANLEFQRWDVRVLSRYAKYLPEGFRFEMELVDAILDAFNQAYQANLVLHQSEDRMEEKFQLENGKEISNFFKNQMREFFGTNLLKKTKSALKNYLWDKEDYDGQAGRINNDFLYKLVYWNEQNRLKPLLKILRYIDNRTWMPSMEESKSSSVPHYDRNVCFGSLNHVNGMPLTWFCFSVTEMNVPYGEDGVETIGFMVLYGWARSLLFSAYQESQTQRNTEDVKDTGMFLLSYLIECASNVLDRPISYVFLESLPPTDLVIQKMKALESETRPGKLVRVPFLSTKTGLDVSAEFGNEDISQGDPDMLVVLPEMRNIWKRFVEDTSQSETKRRKPLVVEANICQSCDIRMTSDSIDAFCSDSCHQFYKDHNKWKK